MNTTPSLGLVQLWCFSFLEGGRSSTAIELQWLIWHCGICRFVWRQSPSWRDTKGVAFLWQTAACIWKWYTKTTLSARLRGARLAWVEEASDERSGRVKALLLHGPAAGRFAWMAHVWIRAYELHRLCPLQIGTQASRCVQKERQIESTDRHVGGRIATASNWASVSGLVPIWWAVHDSQCCRFTRQQPRRKNEIHPKETHLEERGAWSFSKCHIQPVIDGAHTLQLHCGASMTEVASIQSRQISANFTYIYNCSFTGSFNAGVLHGRNTRQTHKPLRCTNRAKDKKGCSMGFAAPSKDILHKLAGSFST